MPTSRPQCETLVKELESKNNVADLLRLIAALQQAVIASKGKPGQAESWLAGMLRRAGRVNEAIKLYEQLSDNGEEPYSGLAKHALMELKR